MYLWSHAQRQRDGVLQNISLRAHPDCQGNVVICDFIGENCISHFHYWHHFIPPGLAGILCVCRRAYVHVCVRACMRVCRVLAYAVPKQIQVCPVAIWSFWRFILI